MPVLKVNLETDMSHMTPNYGLRVYDPYSQYVWCMADTLNM